MKTAYEYLKYIELNNHVEEVTVNGLRVWQFLRLLYANQFFIKNEIYITKISNIKRIYYKIAKILYQIPNIFWQIKNIVNRYDFLLFTDMQEEREISGEITDKIAYNIIKECGENLLIILNPINQRHISIQRYNHKIYLSSNLFYFFAKLESLIKTKFHILNEEIIESIENETKIKVEYKKYIREFLNYVNVFDKYFNRNKPKAIFINCYYGVFHQALIYSARKNKIKTIELQHGLITKEVSAYNIFKNIGNDCLPEYLLTFGDYVKEIVSSNFINKSNIISIGNFYIEYVLEKAVNNKDYIKYFQQLKSNYRKIIAVTSQITIDDELIEFIKAAANLDNSVLYLFIPRYKNKKYNINDFPQNMIIKLDIDFYNTVAFCDYHATVSSMCAMEAPCFGVANILINMKNLSKNYYEEILVDKEISIFIDTPDELLNVINCHIDIGKAEIMDRWKEYYKSNNSDNIKQLLKYSLIK